MKIERMTAVMLLTLMAGPAWGGENQVVDPVTPELLGSAGDAYLRLTTPAMAGVPEGQEVRKAVLEFAMDLPAGTTVELWSHEGEGYPWESEGGSLVDTWTVDERTGDLVRLRLPPGLRAGATLWVRLDPADEDVSITAETVRKAERVVSVNRESRRRP